MKSVQISDEIHQQLKLECVKRGLKMGKVVELAIERLLEMWRVEEEEVEETWMTQVEEDAV